MTKRRDAFLEMSHNEQCEFIAKRLGCDLSEPATWPYALIHELSRFRRDNGAPAFRERVNNIKAGVVDGEQLTEGK